MERMSFDEYGCFLAMAAKTRSEDPHTKVGAVAFSSDYRILGSAYNGLKPKAKIPEWMKDNEKRDKKGNLFIHAESNLCALLKKGECHTICITQSPCIKCCQTIAATGISKVVYLKEYRCQEFKEFFDFHQIEYIELPPSSKQKILDYIKNLNNFSELI